VIMGKKTQDKSRYGIGEWYGKRFTRIAPKDRVKYAGLKGINNERCPFLPGSGMCNKEGGVCSLLAYLKNDDGTVEPDSKRSDLVTLCPNRFWEQQIVFKAVGESILGTTQPTIVKEVGFLQRVDRTGKVTSKMVGRIDAVLLRTNEKEEIEDWCALEMQAVYISGKSIEHEFKAIEKESHQLLFPVFNHRPDFRSSAPKRLMPQLQIKVPSLRRWGKKMAVVVDKPFYDSSAPIKEVPNISNADIAWFIVDYNGLNGQLQLQKKTYTTLESSIVGLTAGEPVTKQQFEEQLSSYLKNRKDKVLKFS